MQNDPSLSAGRIHFDDFEVDVRSHELLRSGHRIRLQEKSFLVLHELLKRPGQVVTREELAAALWPKEYFVDAEHGLNTAVRRLREALGDSADDAKYVETLPKLGYRFVGSVDAAIDPVVSGPPAAQPDSPPTARSDAAPIASPRSLRRGAIVAAAIAATVALLSVTATVVLLRGKKGLESGASGSPGSKVSTEVKDLLARARYLRNHKRVDESKQFVEEALRLEPRNPDALAGRALAYVAEQEYDKARETARRALEIDPSTSEAHRTLGNLSLRGGDFAGAERHFRLAVESDTGDYKTRNRYGRHLLEIGRIDEARKQIEETKRLAPDDPDVQNIWIQYALITGDYESAIREAEIWLSIWEKQLSDLSARGVRVMLAWAYIGARRHDEAIAELRAIHPDFDLPVALALGHAGRVDEAREVLDAHADAAPADGSLPESLLAEWTASACTVIVDFDCAFEHLNRQVAARSYPSWLHYPFFHRIRQDARWPALVKRLEVEFFSGKEELMSPGPPVLFIRLATTGTNASESSPR